MTFHVWSPGGPPAGRRSRCTDSGVQQAGRAPTSPRLPQAGPRPAVATVASDRGMDPATLTKRGPCGACQPQPRPCLAIQDVLTLAEPERAHEVSP